MWFVDFNIAESDIFPGIAYQQEFFSSRKSIPAKRLTMPRLEFELHDTSSLL